MVPETALWFFSLVLGNSICRARSAAKCGASLEDRQAGFGNVLVPGEERPSAAELGLGWQISSRWR